MGGKTKDMRETEVGHGTGSAPNAFEKLPNPYEATPRLFHTQLMGLR